LTLRRVHLRARPPVKSSKNSDAGLTAVTNR
jgi:hypothetical protein